MTTVFLHYVSELGRDLAHPSLKFLLYRLGSLFLKNLLLLRHVDALTHFRMIKGKHKHTL
jgi:hypothetical protein